MSHPAARPETMVLVKRSYAVVYVVPYAKGDDFPCMGDIS